MNQTSMATRRQRRWMIGIALFAVTVGCIAFSLGGSKNQPYYEGKSLEEWFDSLIAPDMYDEEDRNVRAIVTIGSDAVPFLMREFCVSESPWVERFRSLWSRSGLTRRSYRVASHRRERAYYCLLHLGPKADPALPELIKIVENDSNPASIQAIGLLGYFQSNPTTVVPALARRIANPLNPRKEEIFEAAISSLATQGTNARSALPRLKEIESDARIPLDFRIEAACARLSIDPANPQPLDFIVAQWEDTNANVSGGAIVRALNHLGANSIPALPAMRKMAQSRFGTYESFALSNAIHDVETFAGTEPTERQ